MGRCWGGLMRRACIESNGVDGFVWVTLKLGRWTGFYVYSR